MSTILEEMRARATAAKAAAEAAKLDDDETEIARLLDEEDAANAEARASKAARRRIDLKAREAAARKAAAGRYLVRGIDLADHLPPEADLDAAPGGGIFVVRSPTREAVRTMNIDIEAKEKPQDVWAADIVAASVVDPSPDGESGIRLRLFFDDEKNIGCITMLANAVTDLNGTRAKEAKRGRK